MERMLGRIMKRRIEIAAGVTALVTAVCAVRVHSAPLAQDTRTTEANITRLTTSILEHSQFAHHPLDEELAGKFLDGYLDALDGSRSLFLQSDVDEFAKYRATLAQATRNTGDTTAARAILDRYRERLGERAAFVSSLLRAGHFDFTGHDQYVLDREHVARPENLAAAKDLWREELRAEYLEQKLDGARPEQIVSTLTRRYQQQLATMKALKTNEVLEIYLNALAHVYDPHSDYLGHEEAESLSIAMNLSLFGIGASLENADGYCKVREVLPGGPAARGGVLKAGDRIVAVAQSGKDPVNIVNMPLSRAVDLIRGPKGSTVTLTVLPNGAADGSLPEKIPLVRDEVKLEDQRASARIIDLPAGKGETLRLGVLDVPSFYAAMGDHRADAHSSVTADVARLLTKLNAEHVRGVVLDLRRNGGGSLEEAISLTGLFIHRGPVVQTRGPAGDVEVDSDTDPTELYQGPLVVLTSRFSASASEILTGALQDYGRALIVGDSSTFGKGTVQSILPLARVMDEGGLAHTFDPGALKVTIRKFYRPDGASTQLRGVASDIVLPSASDFSDVSESAMKDPLPWDHVAPALHERSNDVKPYVDLLREKSSRRIADEKSFADFAADVARLKKTEATKAVSLNEAERRQKLAEADERRRVRESDREMMQSKMPRTYAITLDNASSPGLPPPVTVKDRKGVAATTSSSLEPADLDESTPEHPYVDDIVLNETVDILADYTNMMNAPNGASGSSARAR